MQAAYRLYPVIALALLAGASLWLERITRVTEPTAASVARSGPDFVAEGTRIVGFGKDGGKRYELVATQLAHYPGDDTTHLEQPNLNMLSDGRMMSLRAPEAVVSPGGERVDLRGGVRAERDGDQGPAAMTFTSERLTVWPEEHRAATDAPVRITQGRTTATALGMQADNLFGSLDLIGNAKVHMPRR